MTTVPLSLLSYGQVSKQENHHNRFPIPIPNNKTEAGSRLLYRFMGVGWGGVRWVLYRESGSVANRAPHESILIALGAPHNYIGFVDDLAAATAI